MEGNLKLFPWDREPDFVNEEGTKWWKDKLSTDYAQKEDIHGTKLNLVSFVVETPDKYRTYVLINKEQEIVAESQKIDGIGIKIDMLKFLKRTK